LFWRTPIVVKYMIHLLALILAACAVCAGLILIEFSSIEPPGPEIRKLADALFSPKQRRLETPSSADDADSPLRDVRLTGIVTGPDLRIAIFAVTGAGPLVLSEGEALKDWRLDSISPERVVLSGPAGNIALKPKLDANLVRSPPPVAVQSSQPELGEPPGAALAAASQQPTAVTAMNVGSLSVAIPVQTQSYPPVYYGGYNQYYPSYGYYPFPYLVYAVPTRVGFGFGFFHHHGGFLRGGFVHEGASHGGGDRAGKTDPKAHEADTGIGDKVGNSPATIAVTAARRPTRSPASLELPVPPGLRRARY
jgi:hypothetical protein